jgi:Ca2+-binding EF-hand superfamily protein
MRAKSSDSDKIEIEENELELIKEDIKIIKNYLKQIKNNAMGLPNNLKGLYDKFDDDNSDEIILKEFNEMMEYIQIHLDLRLKIMLFRLFDRRDIGCFSYEEFADIVDRRMKPNYKRFIMQERQRWNLEGANINWPARESNEPLKIHIKS